MTLRKTPRPVTPAAAAAFLALAAGFAPGKAVAGRISFKMDVLPILQVRCVECHQPGGQGYKKSGLDLRTYEGLMKGTKFGPIVIPGNALISNLNVLVEGRADPSVRMPHDRRKLSSCDRINLRRWVNQGAKNN